MSGDTYLKTEVLYAGGAVQQYIATSPLAFTGADGASPQPPALDECPPLIPPKDPKPTAIVEPPLPPCINIPGYDKCVQIAPHIKEWCGQTWITWNDGVVWERAYDHQPEDNYYHGEAREYVWEVAYYSGGWYTFKSGVTVISPGQFKPQYGNDYPELVGYYKTNFLGGGKSLGSIQVPLNSDGTRGANYGEPMGWTDLSIYSNSPGYLQQRNWYANASWKCTQAQGNMFPGYPPHEFKMLTFNDVCPGATFAHYVDDTYQWNGQRCYGAGWMADTLPVEVDDWTTDPSYPNGQSAIGLSFAHILGLDHLVAPCVLTNVKRGCEPWGIWCNCDAQGDTPYYYNRACPDWEAPYSPDNCPPDCSPPCYRRRVVHAEMEWSNENRDGGSLRYTSNTGESVSPYFTCGTTQGMSIGDLWNQKYSSRQEGVWNRRGVMRKDYSLMPCQPVARHYTNVRSLPDPASFDGVEEYTVDNLGIAHRWVWSHADQQWFEHGEKPAPDGGVI